MPKLKNVTNQNITDLLYRIEEFSGDANDYANRIRTGYVDTIETPVSDTSALIALARNVNELALAILHQAKLQELKAETERLIGEQQKQLENNK
jgi:DNA-binding NtrC family response regulator